VRPTPATVAVLLLVLATLGLMVLTAVTLRPRRLNATVTTQLAPEAQVREREGSARHRKTAVAAPPDRPEIVVAAYYRALGEGRFEVAWQRLTPAVRTAFGGFDHWRAGYRTTLSSLPRGIATERGGTVATVAHELVTADRSPCGPVHRRFAVRWRLVLGAGGWRAASLTAVKRSGPEPEAACAGPS
jgi:hypothetical protein